MTLILIMALMFFALICIGVPIAFSMGTASIWYLLTNGTSLSVAAQKFFTQTQSFSFLAVPFFVLAGTLMVEAGIAKLCQCSGPPPARRSGLCVRGHQHDPGWHLWLLCGGRLLCRRHPDP